MVSGQHCPGEVVETPGARLAPIALPMRLGVIAPVADHRIAAAAGTAHALAPAMLAYQREALGIVQQGREIDQIDGWHDGGGSSHEPVSYSRSRLIPKAAGFISRNGGRHQIGTVAGIASEKVAGM